MKADRKHRRDSWEAALTEEQQAQVYDQARAYPWYVVAKWAAEQFNIRAPGRAQFYRFIAYFREHEQEFRIRQRLADRNLLERELQECGAPDPTKLAAVLGNDVVAARAKGDEDAVARAVRAYKVVAGIVGDTQTFDLKVREFEQAKRAFELKKQDIEIKLRRLEMLERKLAEAGEKGASVDPKALADEIDRILGRAKS